MGKRFTNWLDTDLNDVVLGLLCALLVVLLVVFVVPFV